TGLVCWLLGIRSPEHLHAHPLRGPIFETWVVSEVLKHQTNQGMRSGLSFYRDKDGVEADLVIELGRELIVIEAKAAQTASARLFAGADRLRGLLATEDNTVTSRVVYGGAESQIRSKISLVAWNRLHEDLP
ncbi:MAG: DUF4143 domain-containing protein, partial [Phycisphaerales bacterium]|nr:DUF4143 domain-containing protein [Phycisphaerales bacterium]